MLNNITEFLQILRSVAIHHSPDDLCGRLNTFAVVDQMTQLNADNAEMTRKHYEEGYFFSRDWYNGGADPNKIAKEYDMLIVRGLSIEPYRTDTDSKKWVYPLHLNVVGQLRCEFCPEGCIDTKEGRRLQVAQTLQQVIDELLTYQKYNVTPATGDPFTAWASTAQAAALIGNGTWTDAVWTTERLTTYIKNDAFDIFIPDWSSLNRVNRRVTEKDSLIDGVVAVAVAVYVEICDPTSPFGFDYETHSIQELGVVKCNC